MRCCGVLVAKTSSASGSRAPLVGLASTSISSCQVAHFGFAGLGGGGLANTDSISTSAGAAGSC